MNVQNKAMRRFVEDEMKISANELEYMAENEDVEIVPRFQFNPVKLLQRNPRSADGQYGPFLPLRPVIVPFWLALQLKQQRLCSISPPSWMSIAKLQETLEEERKSRENNLLTKGNDLVLIFGSLLNPEKYTMSLPTLYPLQLNIFTKRLPSFF
jgi:hypothetical protein